jgi:DNA invertase Pin-like site-specific DNA recombinase
MLFFIAIHGGLRIMMGQHARSESLFYYFRIEDQVCVRAGLRNAKAQGARLGRPPLKDLNVAEMQRLRRERRRSRTSFKELAEKYGVSVWTAFQLCKRTKA